MRKALLAIVVASVAACSLATSLDGYSGGEAPRDGAAPDALVDAASSDGGALVDASWCAVNAPDATLCVDFEANGIDLFTQQQTIRGTVSVEPGDASSPPNAMLAVATPSATVYSAVGGAYGDLSTATGARLAFDFRLEDSPAGNGIGVGMLTIGEWSIQINTNQTTVTLSEYDSSSGVYREPYVSPAIDLTRWTHVDVDVTLGPTPQVTFDIGANRVVTDTQIKPPGATGNFTARVGVPYAREGFGPARVRVDNVVYVRH